MIRHEATHALDKQALAEWVPDILREGLAVWVAGGHFKPEPIPERAAALLQLGWYIPLDDLAADFYRQQHETGYIEAAALVYYLVESHGYEQFIAMYTSIDPADDETAALDAALEAAWGAGLDATETSFLRWLELHPPDEAQVRDMELTVRLYDTIRRYQQQYDPMAYFLSGWLPDTAAAVERGVVADLMRHPHSAANVELETMLINAREAMLRGEFDQAESQLTMINDQLTMNNGNCSGK